MRDEKPAPMEIGAGFSSLIGSFAQHSTISYMLYKKLKIKPSQTLLTINAPTGFKETLGELPEGVKISSKASEFQQIHWFVKTKGQMEKELKSIVDRIKPGVICWIYFPKGSSKIQTDLTRDKGWEKLLAIKGLKWLSLISFDETWSAFAMRKELPTEKDKKKPEREIFNWVDPATKTVKLPAELSAALKKNKQLLDYFNSLAFTHKKEYIEWIVTAKKEETRNARVAGTIERLEKGWKNPRNN